MDIFAHGLWTGGLVTAINKKTKKPLRLWPTVFWGVFPDLVAFGPALAFAFWQRITLGGNFVFPHGPDSESLATSKNPIWLLTSHLYSVTHSLIIFLIILGLVCLIEKKPIWEMGGWLLHILIDIPSHSLAFYPTPFLWPVSNFMVNGVSWGQPWFLVLNYSTLFVFYLTLFFIKKKKAKK